MPKKIDKIFDKLHPEGKVIKLISYHPICRSSKQKSKIGDILEIKYYSFINNNLSAVCVNKENNRKTKSFSSTTWDWEKIK